MSELIKEEKINAIYDFVESQKKNQMDLVTINRDNVQTLTTSIEHVSSNKKTDDFTIDKVSREWRYIIGIVISFVFNYILSCGNIVPKVIEDNFLGYFGLGCLTFIAIVCILSHYNHRTGSVING
jgi:hypothetical protein